MRLPNALRIKRDNQKNVFRSSNKKVPRSNLRLSIESFIFFLSGSILITFLNSIPQKSYLGELLNDSWNDLLLGVVKILSSIGRFGSLILIIALLLLSFTLLLAGLARFLRILSRILANSKQTNKIKKRR